MRVGSGETEEEDIIKDRDKFGELGFRSSSRSGGEEEICREHWIETMHK